MITIKRADIDYHCPYCKTLNSIHEIEIDKIDEGYAVWCKDCHEMSIICLKDNPDLCFTQYKTEKVI